MQVWNDTMVEAQIGRAQSSSLGAPALGISALTRTAVPRIAIRSADPLAYRALAATLASAGLGEGVVGDDVAGPFDVVIYDDGPAPLPGMLRAAPTRLDEPWLALVATGQRARLALGGGFRGALGRDVAPEVLASAIDGLLRGIVTIDQRFATEVLPPSTTAVAPLTLTPREHQVLALLAEGLSNKEIGTKLGVSPHTAKFHVTALLDKFGAETRTEAVVLAARGGLLTL